MYSSIAQIAFQPIPGSANVTLDIVQNHRVFSSIFYPWVFVVPFLYVHLTKPMRCEIFFATAAPDSATLPGQLPMLSFLVFPWFFARRTRAP